MNKISCLSLAAALLALGACFSPQSRIKRNSQEFATYPPEIQARIREGKVDIGFTKEEAYMALGKPQRRYMRKTTSGNQEVWAYLAGGTAVAPPVDPLGATGSPDYGEIALVGQDEMSEKTRIVFQDDAVISVETPVVH